MGFNLSSTAKMDMLVDRQWSVWEKKNEDKKMTILVIMYKIWWQIHFLFQTFFLTSNFSKIGNTDQQNTGQGPNMEFLSLWPDSIKALPLSTGWNWNMPVCLGYFGVLLVHPVCLSRISQWTMVWIWGPGGICGSHRNFAVICKATTHW